jgi:hypothetical protein
MANDMTATGSKPAKIKASGPRAETAVSAHRFADKRGSKADSEAQTDLIVDLVEARMRIAALAAMLDKQAKYSAEHSIVHNTVLPLSRQIDSTTALAHKIADRLGIGGLISIG